MQDDLIEIGVSRTIPAPKWRIIRLITKVWEFPSYIPSVKEVSVIQKTAHRMVTKWRVQIDNVSITWVEEDYLDLRHNTVYFRAREGDLEEFRGEWLFNDRPEGTEVTGKVYLRVGIPAIKDFADTYVKNLLTRNFEAILEMLERRLVSIRYRGYRQGELEKLAGFGVIGHLYNFNHMIKCFKMLNPDFKVPSQEFLGTLFHQLPSFKLYDILNFKSALDEITNGCFIVATFIPDMMERDIWAIFSKVVKACKIAEKQGVGIVALGGFTSIVSEKMGQEVSCEVDVPLTTGNTLTCAMAVDGILKVVELLNLDISQARLTIVGGTGDIGSGCARVMVDKVKELTITGRTKENLKKIQRELARRKKAKVFATVDNEKAVRNADVVIAAASVASSILKVDWFKPGAIICDVGYPKNISYLPVTRQDIFIFSGGLVKSPTPVSFPIDIGLPNPDTLYGCFSEAIILALEKRYENFSFGRGNITPEKIDEIRALGKKHGFEVADFYWGDRLIDTAMIDRIKETVGAQK